MPTCYLYISVDFHTTLLEILELGFLMEWSLSVRQSKRKRQYDM
ncbi:hypothetical protein SAMN02910414_01645 [Lachnobacterium bovis DSM 14045]|uniref:Uncharacterized protein n=1 Tax=Lachnobacterium bovis DSM 14045 TaxID=1122142 RepID=A0A1H3K782_9FIRM|nr:hypothetical protein SAMN02910414_01645 [Lachnobacterium bovis DSM 14045]